MKTRNQIGLSTPPMASAGHLTFVDILSDLTKLQAQTLRVKLVLNLELGVGGLVVGGVLVILLSTKVQMFRFLTLDFRTSDFRFGLWA